MARPLSVHSWLGKRKTSLSVFRFFIPRSMMAIARRIASSSEMSEGLLSSSTSAFFSACASASIRACFSASSASASAIFCITSLAEGSNASDLFVMLCSMRWQLKGGISYCSESVTQWGAGYHHQSGKRSAQLQYQENRARRRQGKQEEAS